MPASALRTSQQFCAPLTRVVAPRGSSTEGPSEGGRMRLPQSVQSVSWPPRWALHRRPQWRCSHGSPPTNTKFCGPVRSTTEGPSGGVHMRTPT
eukprot:6092318-Pyramimonas_sp.AAC.1